MGFASLVRHPSRFQRSRHRQGDSNAFSMANSASNTASARVSAMPVRVLVASRKTTHFQQLGFRLNDFKLYGFVFHGRSSKRRHRKFHGLSRNEGRLLVQSTQSLCEVYHLPSPTL